MQYMIQLGLTVVETGVVVGGFYYLLCRIDKMKKTINHLEWQNGRTFDRIFEIESKLAERGYNDLAHISDLRGGLTRLQNYTTELKLRVDKIEQPFEIIHGKNNEKTFK